MGADNWSAASTRRQRRSALQALTATRQCITKLTVYRVRALLSLPRENCYTTNTRLLSSLDWVGTNITTAATTKNLRDLKLPWENPSPTQLQARRDVHELLRPRAFGSECMQDISESGIREDLATKALQGTPSRVPAEAPWLDFVNSPQKYLFGFNFERQRRQNYESRTSKMGLCYFCRLRVFC